MTPTERRAARLAQAKHRGTKRSHVTALEDALIVLAWEATLLSEGQVSRLLDMDRVSLRIRRETLLADAMRLAEAMDAERGK